MESGGIHDEAQPHKMLRHADGQDDKTKMMVSSSRTACWMACFLPLLPYAKRAHALFILVFSSPSVFSITQPTDA
jgi:hypothetical protein